MLTRTSVALVLVSVGFVACGADGSGPEDASFGEESQAITAKGRAVEGAACLVAPVYRKDKCVPGLSCATASPNAAAGTCTARHGEAQPCDAQLGNQGCAAGLSCTAKPTGGAFCKGHGTGVCHTANHGLDCASGYLCVATPPAQGAGTCQASGAEGTPCDDDLIENGCDPGLTCVVSTSGTTAGTCARQPAGGLGVPCGQGQPDPSKCADGSVCAIAQALVGQRYDPQTAPFRCAAAAAIGEQCIGVFSSSTSRLHGSTRCADYMPCYPAAGGATPYQNFVTTGVCAAPVGTAGATCGGHGVDDCGNEWISGGRLVCIGGVCRKDNAVFGETCSEGTTPDGRHTNNCTWSYRGRQMSCVHGKCG